MTPDEKEELKKDVEQKLKETKETIDSYPNDESIWSLEQQKKVTNKLDKTIRAFNKWLRAMKVKKQ